MRFTLFILVLGAHLSTWAQSGLDTTQVNARYFEDQFYLGVTYNFLLDKPALVSQRNFSYGLQGGMIKDIPLSIRRTFGLGVGLGLALNTYYTNIVATEIKGGVNGYAIDFNADFERNKIETHLIEMPIEFRWRNSTASTYNFWRIYTGFKLGYNFDTRSKSVADTVKNSFSNADVRKFQYGLTLNFGYSSFNAHVYYALTDIFDKQATLGSNTLSLKPLQVGLIFYML